MRFLITNRQFDGQKFTAVRNPQGLTFWIDGQPADAAAFLQALSTAGKKPVLFVHGFNNDEEKSARMAEQVANCLPDKTVVLFSWNSAGNVLEYAQDQARLGADKDDLYQAILLLNKPGVIAHSMGNHLLQMAIDEAAKAIKPGPDGFTLVDSLAMVAADVDATALRDSAFGDFVRRGQVFYCLEDGALVASSALRGGLPRLGLTGPIGGAPKNFVGSMNCTVKLLRTLDPIAKHSQYFFQDWFYQAVERLMAPAQGAAA